MFFFIASIASLSLTNAKYMECGTNVKVCGVLAMETAHGHGMFGEMAGVNGLWPQRGDNGNSECVEPAHQNCFIGCPAHGDGDIGPNDKCCNALYECFEHADEGRKGYARWLEGHIWNTHGHCAGLRDSDDYFGQVCQLSARLLGIIRANSDKSFEETKTIIENSDKYFEVFDVTLQSQILLSACLNSASGEWILAPVSEFERVCGGAGACMPNRPGPPCNSDKECSQYHSCVRCSHAGYCSNEYEEHNEL